jgi:hypothetical protein
VSVIGIGFASAFTGVFIADSGMFQSCNTTEYTNDTLKKEEEICLEECKGYTIAHFVFMAIFCSIIYWSCKTRLSRSSDSSPKLELAEQDAFLSKYSEHSSKQMSKNRRHQK